MQWSAQPIGGSYLAVLLVTAALACLLAVRPGNRTLGVARRRLIAGLRLAVILLVGIALLRPTLVKTTSKPQTASLLILLDTSRSMQLPDASEDVSRWTTLRQTLQQCAPLLGRLGERLELKLYGFDSQLHRLNVVGGECQLPSAPTGRQTDIGTCLDDAVRGELGKRVAGVVMLSDGTQTAFEPRTEIQEAGRQLARLGAPLYAVPFGPAGDAAQARDVAVESMPDQYTVFVKNELTVQAVLRVRGYVNKDIPLRLAVEDPRGQQQVLGPLTRRARQDDQQVEVAFDFTPRVPGEYKLTLQADLQPGEILAENNQLSAFLTVLEGGLRVLYLDIIRWERKFLRRAIDASPDMELDAVLIDPRSSDRWPVSLDDQLAKGLYDAIIIGDVDAAALGDENLQRMADLTDRGKGLIMIGGYHSFGPGGYRNTPLAAVLPVEMERFERQDYQAPLREDLHWPGPLQMLPRGVHAVTRLGGEQDNEAIWRALPPLTGANKFAAIKQAPGVRVLAATPDGRPLLVSGEYGRGRVLAFAADSTYRWPLAGHEQQHKRFWRQVILWLVQRDELEPGKVWVRLPRRRYRVGEPIEFAAGARTGAGDPVPEARLSAELMAPDGQRRPLTVLAGQEQATGAVEPLEMPGDYAIIVTASDGRQTLGEARVRFQLRDDEVELINPAADPDQLAQLAGLTREAGGRLIAPPQLAALLEDLVRRPPKLEIEVQTRWQLGDTAWDAWLFLLVFVTLLTSEWALRKRWGLV